MFTDFEREKQLKESEQFLDELQEELEEERILSEEIDRLQEMAVHCDANDQKGMYIVVGGTPWWERGKNGNGNQKEHNPPHAHILWIYKGKKISSRFQIVEPNPPEKKEDLKTVDDTDVPLNSIADTLISWAKENPRRYKEQTNWEAMRSSWIQIQDMVNLGLKNPVILTSREDYEKEINQSKSDKFSNSNDLDNLLQETNHFLNELQEELKPLQEMSNIYKDETDLPVNIWIDAAKEYITGKHAKRIKFQINTGNNIGGQPTCPMMLNGKIPPTILKKNTIKSDFISEVQNFVLNNKFALDKAADELIRDSEFKRIMIKSGKPATDEQKKELIHQTKIFIKKRLDNNKFDQDDKPLAEAALAEFPEIPCD